MPTFSPQSLEKAPQPNQQPSKNQAFLLHLQRISSYGNFVYVNIRETHPTPIREASSTSTARKKTAQSPSLTYCSKLIHSKPAKQTLLFMIFYLSFVNYLIIGTCSRSSRTMRDDPNSMLNYYDCHLQRLRVHAPYFLALLAFFIWVQKSGADSLNTLNIHNIYAFNLHVQRFLSVSSIGKAHNPDQLSEEDEEFVRMECGASSSNSPTKEEGSKSTVYDSWENILLIKKMITLQEELQKPRSRTPSNGNALKIDHAEIEKEKQARRLKMCRVFFREMRELDSWKTLKTLREYTSDINTSSYSQLSAQSCKQLSATLSRVLLSLDYQAYKTFITITKMNDGMINADLPLVYSQQLLFILMRSLDVETLTSEFPDFIDMHKTVFESMGTINSLRLVNKEFKEAINNAWRLQTFFKGNNSDEAPHSTQTSHAQAENKKMT